MKKDFEGRRPASDCPRESPRPNFYLRVHAQKPNHFPILPFQCITEHPHKPQALVEAVSLSSKTRPLVGKEKPDIKACEAPRIAQFTGVNEPFRVASVTPIADFSARQGMGHGQKYINLYTGKELQTGEYWDASVSTGLEMYDFGSRFYDPAIGRWHTPDPAEQFQNPYLAMGNNPVVYVDPDREFIGTVITAVFDFLRVGFTEGGFEFWNWGSKNFNDAWREFDPTAKWSKTNKALRIDLGLFKTDKDKNFLGRAWQFTKRHTWQKYNTILGNLNSHKNNITGDVQRVDYFHGSTVVYNYGEGGGGSSLGGYININQYDRSGNAHETNFGNALLLHEYGHYLQEQAFGPLTLFSGINSGLSANGDKIFPGVSFNTTGHHDQAWFEQDANARSLSYFSRKDDFNNYIVGPGFSAADNFNADFPFQYKTNRFLWYLPPFTLGHILYTAFKRTNP